MASLWHLYIWTLVIIILGKLIAISLNHFNQTSKCLQTQTQTTTATEDEVWILLIA